MRLQFPLQFVPWSFCFCFLALTPAAFAQMDKAIYVTPIPNVPFTAVVTSITLGLPLTEPGHPLNSLRRLRGYSRAHVSGCLEDRSRYRSWHAAAPDHLFLQSKNQNIYRS